MGEIKAASTKLATLPAIALLVDAPFSLCISRHPCHFNCRQLSLYADYVDLVGWKFTLRGPILRSDPTVGWVVMFYICL